MPLLPDVAYECPDIDTIVSRHRTVGCSQDEQGRPRSVIVVTHDYRALRFADLIYHMEDGLLQPASPELLMRVWQTAMIHHALPSIAQDGGIR